MLMARKPAARLAAATVVIGIGLALVLGLGLASGQLALPAGLRAPAVPQPVAVAEIALRSGDVPGITRCPISGEIGKYLAGLQTAGSPGYEVLQSEWTRIRGLGARQGYASSFAKSPNECTARLGERQSPSAISFSFQFQKATAAATAFENGFLDLRPARDLNVPGLQQGTGTGLGTSAWTFYQAAPEPAIYAAYWARGDYLVFLLAENVDPAVARRAALNIDSRVR
jgi:hypothetical protein